MYRTFVLLTNSDSEGYRFRLLPGVQEKIPGSVRLPGIFVHFFRKRCCLQHLFLSPWKRSTHTAYFPSCLHILFRQDFAAVEGDERMGFIVLGILCAAAVVVTLACLWINR